MANPVTIGNITKDALVKMFYLSCYVAFPAITFAIDFPTVST